MDFPLLCGGSTARDDSNATNGWEIRSVTMKLVIFAQAPTVGVDYSVAPCLSRHFYETSHDRAAGITALLTVIELGANLISLGLGIRCTLPSRDNAAVTPWPS
jgi:hypothetical protein